MNYANGCNIFLALTSETTLSVGTFCIFGTVIHSGETFLDISAVFTVTNETSITCTFITTWGIVTCGIGVTVVVTCCAFIDVHTCETVSKEAFVTNTFVTTFLVVTSGEHGTSLPTHHHSSTFIFIRTCFASSKVSIITCTSE